MTETKRGQKAQTINDNAGGLPYGFGSIQKRGASWWMVYRNFAGERVQENTGTANVNEARVKLIKRALEIAAEKAAFLEGALEAAEAVLNEEKATEAGYDKLAGGWVGTEAAEGEDGVHAGGERGRGGRTLSADSKQRQKRGGSKKGARR